MNAIEVSAYRSPTPKYKAKLMDLQWLLFTAIPEYEGVAQRLFYLTPDDVPPVVSRSVATKLLLPSLKHDRPRVRMSIANVVFHRADENREWMVMELAAPGREYAENRATYERRARKYAGVDIPPRGPQLVIGSMPWQYATPPVEQLVLKSDLSDIDFGPMQHESRVLNLPSNMPAWRRNIGRIALPQHPAAFLETLRGADTPGTA